MELWRQWWKIVVKLRPAFSRSRTFLWFTVALAAMCVRGDRLGVTSLIRALGLREACYDRLLDWFHSSGLNLDVLTRLWTALIMTTLKRSLYRVQGRAVLVADGIKVAKTGRKMPAVKKLHQESDNNNKPQFIFGHSCQAVGVIVHAAKSFLAVPLACRIHEGIVLSNRDRRSLLDKLITLVISLAMADPSYLVVDAYYAAGKIIRPILKLGHHLVTTVRFNAVAYELAATPAAKTAGRPRTYGKKIKIKTLFDDPAAFTVAPSPIYGETKVSLMFRVCDLCWKPAGIVVRFVLVIHPTRGRKILMTTDRSLSPIQIMAMYGVRFKIEVSFKQAIYTIGTYSYHFWMRAMTPRSRRSGNQHLHRKTKTYRKQVARKIAAYHAHIQLGVIAQGILQTLALSCPRAVWKHFGSWLRTIRSGVPPSEMVVAIAMRHSLPIFLADSPPDHILAKFIRQNIDLTRSEGASMVAA